MRTKKVSNRTFYGMIAVIVLLIAICAGTTLALFTDRLTSTGNTYTFGKIDIAWKGAVPTYQAKRTIGIDATEHLMPGDEITIHAEIVNEEEAAFVRKIVEIEFVCNAETCVPHTHSAEEGGCQYDGAVCEIAEHTAHTVDCYMPAAERTKLINSFLANEDHEWQVIAGDVANAEVGEELAVAQESVKFRYVEIVALESPGNIFGQTATSGVAGMPTETTVDVAVIIPLELSNAWVDLQVNASLHVEAVQQANLIAVDKDGKVSTIATDGAVVDYDYDNIVAVYMQDTSLAEDVTVVATDADADGKIEAGEIATTGAKVYFDIFDAEHVELDVAIDGEHEVKA